MKTPQPTRVPEVCDAILTVFAAIADVTVLDGPQAKTPLGDVLALGVGDESVIVTNIPQSGYGTGLTEKLDVVCTAYSWSGSTVMKPRRDRVAEILAAVDTELRNDPTLGGVCDEASLGSDAVWKFENGDQGASCSVGFSIAVKSLI